MSITPAGTSGKEKSPLLNVLLGGCHNPSRFVCVSDTHIGIWLDKQWEGSRGAVGDVVGLALGDLVGDLVWAGRRRTTWSGASYFVANVRATFNISVLEDTDNDGDFEDSIADPYGLLYLPFCNHCFFFADDDNFLTLGFDFVDQNFSMKSRGPRWVC